MKKLNWFNKIAYFFNIVLVLLTLAGYLLPSMAPKLFPFLSVLTLILPTLLILNLFFVGYWAVQLKRQAFLSIVVFLIGFTFFTKFYKFSSKNEEIIDSDFTVLDSGRECCRQYQEIYRGTKSGHYLFSRIF